MLFKVSNNFVQIYRSFSITGNYGRRSFSKAPLWRMGPRCSSAETQVCHRSYIIAATPTGVYNTSFWSIRRIQYNRRKHNDLLSSEKKWIGWAVQKLWPFWWAKSGRFSVFWKNVKKMTFLDQHFFSLLNRSLCFLLLYCILLMLQKELLYTPVGVTWKKCHRI
jgi:hypothetical protein